MLVRNAPNRMLFAEQLKAPPNVHDLDTQFSTHHVCCKSHHAEENRHIYSRRGQHTSQNISLTLIFLYCIILLFLPLPGIAQHAFQQPMLQPSQSFLSSLDNEDQNLYREEAMFENFNKIDSDSNWFLEESCSFTATVGRLFNQSLQEKMKKLYPDIITEQHQIKMRTTNFHFIDWILYNETSGIIQGVPLSNHSILPYNFMVTLSEEGSIVKTISCRIEVVTEESSQDSDLSLHLHWKPGLNALGCLPTEPVVTLGILLDVDKAHLTAEKRIQLLDRLKFFIPTFNEIQRNSISLETENFDGQNAFLSGRGNIVGAMNHPPGVGVQWSLGCGADSVELTGLDVIEKSSRNGSLSKLLGYPIAGWRVVNRKPVQVHSAKLNRFKRQIDDSRNPPTKYPSAIRLPGAPNHDNPLTSGSREVEDDSRSFLNDERKLVSPGRRRVPNYLLGRSPVVSAPQATPYVPSPPKRPMLSQSSPTVIDPPSSPIPPKINLPPEKEQGVSDINVHGSTYFEYRIPKDAFYDKEEGNTRFLSLKVRSTDELSSEDELWLMLNSTYQLIYGVTPKKFDNSKKTSKPYLMIAEDSDGKSSTDIFAIHLLDKPRPTNHRFVFYFSSYDKGLSLPVLTSTFARKLSLALEARWHVVRPPGQITVLKVDRSEKTLTVSWIDNALGSKKKCNDRDLFQILTRMVGETNSDSANKRLSPIPEFKNSFRPNFELKSVKFVLLGPCAVETVISTIPPTLTSGKGVSVSKKKVEKIKPPPIILPPLPPNSLSKTSEFLYEAPMLLDPSYEMNMASTVNKATVEHVDEFVFIGGPVPPIAGEFNLSLTANFGTLPKWVSVSSTSWSVVSLPMIADILPLDDANSTHKLWRGTLSAIDGYGRETESVPINIFITLPSNNVESKESVTHLFQMKIINYDLQNFTVLDSSRLLSVIQDLYGDKSTDSIFVHPLETGSVIFSWHNDSLQSNGVCPYLDIAELGTTLFENGTTAKMDVYKRLLDAGFEISLLELRKMNICSKSTYATTVMSTTLKPTATSTTKSTDDKVNKDDQSTTSKKVEVSLDAAGSSIGLIIVIVVLICLVALVVLGACLCRRNAAKKRSNNEKKPYEPPEGNGSTAPSSVTPFLSEDNKKNSLGAAERQMRYKASAPVILEGEAESGDKNTSLSQKSPSPLLGEPSAPPARISNNREDSLSGVVEPMNDISCALDTERPPPPPYHKPPDQNPQD